MSDPFEAIPQLSGESLEDVAGVLAETFDVDDLIQALQLWKVRHQDYLEHVEGDADVRQAIEGVL